MKAAEKLISIAMQEVGYLEKKSNSQLDSKTANAGSNNYTKYARDLYPSLQGQAWCDMFVDWCFVQAFGQVAARQLIGGGFSAYTPTSAQYYKNQGRYHKTNPEPGDQIFFKNSQRICHTGIVVKATNAKVYTIEGNTSGASGVIANGGGVCQKEYPVNAAGIDGFGRPDWSLVEKQEGFRLAADGKRWWYQYNDGTYPTGWAYLQEKTGGTFGWYLFDANGYMLTGYQTTPDGKKYFLCPDPGIHEGQCMVTNDQGELAIKEYDSIARRYFVEST